MADTEKQHRLSAFRSAPPTPWEHPQSDYMQSHHSHHGTPAQEMSGFDFGMMSQSPLETHRSTGMQPRSMAPQLQQLIMPAMPSMPLYPSMLANNQPHALTHRQSSPMLNGYMHSSSDIHPHGMSNGQSHSATYSPSYQQDVQPIQPVPIGPLHTPVSATSTKSNSAPRKTLTDADRRRMCEYAENHPQAKQMEIGTIFGVERSTVSKVLRQKEKYLQQDDESRSPHKRLKGKLPDIERTLANWARNQEKKGVALTDDDLRSRVLAFVATSANPEVQQSLTASWFEKFKLKYDLMRARSRKSSLAPDESEAIIKGISPVSPALQNSPPSTELHSVDSRESLKESPERFLTFSNVSVPFHSQSLNSSNSAFTDAAMGSSFSPGPLSPVSPLFTPESATAPSPFVPSGPLAARAILPAIPHANTQRPRSQTAPHLDHYVTASFAEDTTPRYIHSSALLDSPMEEPSDPLNTISSTLGSHGLKQDPFMISHTISPVDSRTVSPSDTMRPPPIPAHILAGSESRRGSLPAQAHAIDSPRATSAEEARAALDVVLKFFRGQPQGYLERQESVILERLTERLNLQARDDKQ